MKMTEKAKFMLKGYEIVSERAKECRERVKRLSTLELNTQEELVQAREELRLHENYLGYLKECLAKKGVVV